jgi:RHS repeat-associated protein
MFRHYLLSSRLLLTLAILSLNTALALGQQTSAARPDRGVMPNGSYSVSEVENISLQNGNVNLNIGLASLPPIAGGKLSWSFNAQYNSKIWDVVRTEQMGESFDLSEVPYVVDSVQQSDRGGWRMTGQYGIDIRDAHSDFDYQIPPVGDEPDRTLLINYNWYKAVFIMPDGSEHELRPVDYTPFSGGRDYLFGYYKETPFTHGTMRYYSYDGSFIYATVTASGDWTAYLPDGIRVMQTGGIQRIQDTNGNKIKIFTDSNGTHYQDEQTGREIRYFYDPAGNGGKGQGQLWYQAVGSTWMHIDINFDTTFVQGKLYTVNDWVPGQINPRPCIHKQLLSQTVPVVKEIVYPQTEPTQSARRFTFTYNSDATESATTTGVRFSCSGSGSSYTRTVSKGWGSLSKMVTPSGGEVQYAYEMDSGAFDANSVFSPDDIPAETITKKTVVQDGPDDVWTYVIWPDLGSASQTYLNDNSVMSENSYGQMAMLGSGFGGGYYGVSGLVYRTTKPFQKIERHWTNLIFTGAQVNSPGGTVAFNPVVDAEYTTLTDASGNNLKMSAKTYQYDYNGNVTQTTEYDWFDPGSVSRDGNGVPTAVPVGATVLRTTTNTYYNSATSASSANVYAKRPIATGAPLILNALKETTVGPSIAQFSYDGQSYGVAPTAGNLTTKKFWVNLDSKWITTSSTYGLYGNLATSTDGLGRVTQYLYDDATHALPNRVVVDPQNSTGTQTTTAAYDYYTGLVTSRTDPNGQVTTISYTNQLLGTVDPFGRPGITRAPEITIGGTNHGQRTTTTYIDSARQVIVAIDWNVEGDQLLKTRTTTDASGRPVLTEQTEDGANYTISVKNAYLDSGRVTLSSGPMRATAAVTDGWTRVTKDSGGRVIEVAAFGGATQPAWTGTSGVYNGAVTTAYDANFTTVTDQAGKVRRSMLDALGRLLRVDEPDDTNNLGSTASPVLPTNYTYDVLSNLTAVTQGSQTRTFTYDSLSHLRTAVNPESGTVSHQYDDNGNLVVKTDARGVSTHFAYDSINRLTRRWYNGSNLLTATTHNSPALPAGVGATDEAKLYYDTQSLPVGAPTYTRGSAIGRLVAETYGTGSNGDYYAYDVLGRATLKIQQTGTVNYQMSSAYNLSGTVGTLTYPSGHTVTHTYDQAGRLTALSGNLGDGSTRTYSTGILYSALGGMVKEQLGTTTPVYNKLFYNSRGQLAEIRTGTSYTGPGDTTFDRGAIINSYSNLCTGVCSGSSMSDNNGNLIKQDIQIPSVATRSQSYEYDRVNRLKSAREVMSSVEQWKQQFTYDRWGNRTIDTGVTYGAGINNKAFTVNTAHNRLGVPVGQPGTMTYDAAGNLTTDSYTGMGGRTYDAENKMTQAADNTGQVSRYTYDSNGNRVKRQVASSQEEWQIYGFGGELLAEYRATAPASSPQKEYGYRDGQLLVTATGRYNVALGANGAIATASSTATGSGFSTAYAINGNYRGPWGNNVEGWNDWTPNVVPDWIQVDFAGSKTLDEISVFSLHDNYTVDNTPTETQTFTLYGLLAFDVQYWNGSSWTTIPGGSVTGNNKVWRKFTFSPITTSKIRVTINAVPDSWSRVVEIQAFGTSAGDEKVQWLVSDQLGTPRMVFDQTGNLATMKRHDYLPFGEELLTGVSGRSVAQGYGVGDGVRQQFTEQERDIETGLDYFLARFYSSTQGRFTSADPFNLPLATQEAAASNPEKAKNLFTAYLSQPQQWNRYAYGINNPLLYVDPTGEAIQLSNDKEERERQMQALKEAVGSAAAGYLYVNEGKNADGTANYYVGIYDSNPQTGDKRSFEQVNEVAGEFGAIVRDSQVAKLEFVKGGVVEDDYGDRRTIGRATSSGLETPAVTGYFKGQLTIKMLDWSKRDIGYLPGAVMSDNRDNGLTPSVMLGHELGHARARMTGYRDKRGNRDSTDGSLRLENKIRKLQYPNGPTRKSH